jgi:hypothetical protein
MSKYHPPETEKMPVYKLDECVGLFASVDSPGILKGILTQFVFYSPKAAMRLLTTASTPVRKDDRHQFSPPHLQVDTLLTRIAAPLTDPLASPSAPADNTP